MTDDEQFCPKEGAPHERHCVFDQGHWVCEGEPGATVEAPAALMELAAAQLEAFGAAVVPSRLRALLSRPTPSAEPCTGGDGCTAPVHLHGCFADQGDCNSPDEHTPPRIADMPPGTTFTGALDRAFSDNRPFRFMVVSRIGVQQVVDSDGDIWFPGDLDPSTIRDITPPTPTT